MLKIKDNVELKELLYKLKDKYNYKEVIEREIYYLLMYKLKDKYNYKEVIEREIYYLLWNFRAQS